MMLLFELDSHEDKLNSHHDDYQPLYHSPPPPYADGLLNARMSSDKKRARLTSESHQQKRFVKGRKKSDENLFGVINKRR